MSKTSVAQFFKEVKQEGKKVTWPTKKETTMTTIMVCIMVFLAAMFFLLADQVISTVIQWVLGIGG